MTYMPQQYGRETGRFSPRSETDMAAKLHYGDNRASTHALLLLEGDRYVRMSWA